MAEKKVSSKAKKLAAMPSQSALFKPAKSAETVFQFKISLKGVKPTVWRRIQVGDCTLGTLSGHLLNVFGWSGGHLHAFSIHGIEYGSNSDDFGLEETEDEDNVTLGELLPADTPKVRWNYLYDFGDNWQHVIEFEGHKPRDTTAKYPQCIAGARACPPDDCGGVWGYQELLEKIADPNHPEHQETLEWCGNFDAEDFDVTSATQSMVWSTF